jgi:hypothetical protein
MLHSYLSQESITTHAKIEKLIHNRKVWGEGQEGDGMLDGGGGRREERGGITKVLLRQDPS